MSSSYYAILHANVTQVESLLWFLKVFSRYRLGLWKNIWYIILIAVDQILMTIKQLKQVTLCCINWLCLSLICIMYMLYGHSASQEIKHIWKFISGFIGPQILNFERSLNLSPGPQSSHVLPCKISRGNSLIFKCPKSHGTVLVKCSLKAFVLIGWLLHYLYSLRAVFLINIET